MLLNLTAKITYKILVVVIVSTNFLSTKLDKIYQTIYYV